MRGVCVCGCIVYGKVSDSSGNQNMWIAVDYAVGCGRIQAAITPLPCI